MNYDSVEQMRTGDRDVERLMVYTSDLADVVGGFYPVRQLQGDSSIRRLFGEIASEINRQSRVSTDGLDYFDYPIGRGLSIRRKDDDSATGRPGMLYDIISLGGYGYFVPNSRIWYDDAWLPGYLIVEDAFGEDFPVIEEGLTAWEVNTGMWCWGPGNDHNHFSIAAVAHGNPRNWRRLPVDDPRWWHDNVPEEEIYARNWDESYGGAPVCLTLTIGVKKG